MKNILLQFVFVSLNIVAHAQLQVNNTVYLSPGAIMSVSSGDVNLNTDILGTGTLLLNAGAAQVINARSYTIPRLQIDNPADVRMVSSLSISQALVFANGHLITDTGTLRFNVNAASPATASASSFIVTGGTGNVSKLGLNPGSSFLFPVGLNTNDYAPAKITNTSSSPRTINTNVQNNTGTNPLTGNPGSGINRIWRINADTAATATVELTHNAGNEGSAFKRDSAFITRQAANGVWDVSAGAMATVPNYTHSRTGILLSASGFGEYFSKSSNSAGSISDLVATRLDIVIGLQGIMLGNGVMTTNLQNYDGSQTRLLPTTDPYGVGTIYPGINNATGTAGAVCDWVKVEIRKADDPSAVLQTLALLLKPDGHIVDIEGKVPAFNTCPDPVKIAVYHRNHIAVLSNPVPVSGGFTGNQSYNFTASLSQASNAYGDPAQMRLIVNKWCLWAGDMNQDFYLDGSDASSVNSRIGRGDDTYQVTDLNQDGYVDGSDAGRLNFNLNGILPSSTLANY